MTGKKNSELIFPAWLSEGACWPKEGQEELLTKYFFYDERGLSKEERQDYKEKAKAICHTCNHQVECLEYAITYSIEDGIWGGLTVHERKEIGRRRAASAREAAA